MAAIPIAATAAILSYDNERLLGSTLLASTAGVLVHQIGEKLVHTLLLVFLFILILILVILLVLVIILILILILIVIIILVVILHLGV